MKYFIKNSFGKVREVNREEFEKAKKISWVEYEHEYPIDVLYRVPGSFPYQMYRPKQRSVSYIGCKKGEVLNV